jgi:UDP-N-acetylglucosamine 4,6-dehydratase
MAFDRSFGQSILITGGTGSFGNALVSYLLDKSRYKKIIIFSRDELKQSEMRQKFHNDERLRWFLGDIRDQNRLKSAFHSVDTVIHAAALKQVETAEYNPIEFVKTNVYGSQNVIEVAIECGVAKVIALSTDKASSPINLYGATKLTADKLFLSAKSYSGANGTKFSVVRYGNVGGSRGSVIPLFIKQAKLGQPLPITDLSMTRFHIRLEKAVNLVSIAHKRMVGGELFVPQIPSYKISDLVKVIGSKDNFKIIGIRPGEKMHEEMISVDEGRNTYATKNYYLILQEGHPLTKKLKKVPTGFNYNSKTNPVFLDLAELKNEVSNIKLELGF